MRKGLWSAIAAIAIAAMVLGGSTYWERETGGGQEGGDYPHYDPGPVPNGTMPPAPDVPVPDKPPPPDDESKWKYSLPLDSSDVWRFEDVSEVLHLTADQRRCLIDNGLVGTRDTPEDFTRFADAYDWIDLEDLPMFITSDSVLDAFHHHYLNVLRQVEQGALGVRLRTFSERMVTLSQRQMASLPVEHRALAKQNMAFFGIALRLLDQNATFTADVMDEISTAVRLIEGSEGTMTPVGFSHVEDLTQYRPRGHYASSEQLSRYFRAMMWYGRLTFSGDSPNETRMAVLASIAIQGDYVAKTYYDGLRTAIAFLVGMPDDLTPEEYVSEATAVMGNLSRDLSPLFDNGLLAELQDRLESLRPPRIESDLTPPEVDIWGLRVLGQAFVLDSYIFERCTSEEVPGRYCPSGIDVMAALGSEEALSREPLDEFAPELETNLRLLREEMATKDKAYWSANIYSSWLHLLQCLDNDTWASAQPPFMRTELWDAKQLNTQLASWAQLCHDTVLYRKPTYVYMGIPTPKFTYVEPQPLFFWRLSLVLEYLDVSLATLGLGTDMTHKELRELDEAVRLFYALSVKQICHEDIDDDTMTDARESYKRIVWGDWNRQDVDEADTVVVADVHTVHDASRPVYFLEEGVGLVRLLVVVAPSRDGPVACIGPVFEHYEFTRSADLGRLTDEEWAAMLKGNTAPDPAPWALDFMR